MMRLQVRWQEGGLSLDNTEHAQYIAEVTASLTKQLTSTIDTIIEEHQNKVTTHLLVLYCSEVLQSAALSKSDSVVTHL